jgi:[histone H3]-lysine9 N-trimethyltransferase SUV39H
VKIEVQLAPSESHRLSKTTSERHVPQQAHDYHDVSLEVPDSDSEGMSTKARTSAVHPEIATKERTHHKKGKSANTARKQGNGTKGLARYYSESSAKSSFLEAAEFEYRALGETLGGNLRSVSPEAKNHPRSKTAPSRPIVVVEINNPPQKSATKLQSDTHLLLEQFRQPLPTSKPDTNRTKSLVVREAKHNREGPFLRERRKETSVAQSHASTVEGFSKQYEYNPTMDQRKSIAQPKAKKVDRSKIKLDMGEPTPGMIFPFDPADVVPPKEQIKRLLDARFKNLPPGAPLTFVNERNDQHIHGKFQFINSYIYRDVPKAPLASSDSGCMCSGCDANDTACSCLQMQDKEKPAPYIRSQDGVTILNPDFIDAFVRFPQEIFECNDSCKCSKDCFNRVVQRGRTIPLQIFMTEHCGFGIRSPQPIKKGQFIDVYLGELLTTKSIEDYENATSETSSSYVFSLDWFGPATYHIQGLHFGSPTRFINHSCNPNTRAFTVMMNHTDQKLYKLAYFATKDIPAMKEITFDYCPELAHEPRWVPTDYEEDQDVVRCFCGEKNCRGRIWAKQAHKRKGRGRAKGDWQG